MTHTGVSPSALTFTCSFICDSYPYFKVISKHVNEKMDGQNGMIHTTGTTLFKPLFGGKGQKMEAGLKHKTSAVAFPTVLIQPLT